MKSSRWRVVVGLLLAGEPFAIADGRDHVDPTGYFRWLSDFAVSPIFRFRAERTGPARGPSLCCGITTRGGVFVALTLALLFPCFLEPCSALAKEWQKLPDGRVVIELKDVRIALPATGPDTELITFTNRHHIRDKVTLKEAIVDPTAARRLFERADLVFVSLPNLQDRSGLYLGKFPRSEFKSVGVGFAVGKGATADCESWTGTFAHLGATLTKDDPRLAPYGWAKFKLRENLDTEAYVRSPSGESGKAFFPGISCNYFKVCSSTKCLKTNLTVSYGFSSRVIEQREWLSLDQRVGDLLKYIFVDL